jgi:hypothetical protein
VVSKCIEINPEDRFQTARELSDALESWKSGSAAPIRARSLRWLRDANARGLKWISAGLALLLIGMLTFLVRNHFINKPAANHSPVTVLISDFSNHTGDPVFDGTLEPMLKLALEGAGFISAYDRTQLRALGVPAVSGKFDEQVATKIAVGQGLGVVISGSLDRQGDGFVAEQLLYLADVHPGHNEATGKRMPQTMPREALQARRLQDRLKPIGEAL